MTLFDPTRHEALSASQWNEDRAEEAITRLIDKCRATVRAEGWPTHPNDRDDSPAATHGLYFGTAGIVWSLAQLGADVPQTCALLRHAADACAAHPRLDDPDYRRGLLLTPTGIHLVASLLCRDTEATEALYALVRDNTKNPVLEFMWGASGTMLASNALFDATGDDRWRVLFRESARELERALTVSRSGVRLWEQALYGSSVMHLGAVHGFASNLAPIVAARRLLTNDEFARWRQLAYSTAKATAFREQRFANWMPSIDGIRPGPDKLLVQICHGAPGMIVALGELMDGTDSEFDALMLAAGELVWHAGPLSKGAGLCHGTGGNGYAFLRLYAQTRDEKWLVRARAFAMHALDQSQLAETAYGDLRYSLWTGDLGTALYLRACRTLDPRFPTLTLV